MPGLSQSVLSSTLSRDGEISDRQLLHRWCRERDELAFELLLHRHGPLVWGVCCRILPCPAHAEDAFQATFLTLIRKADSIRSPEALSGWLYRIATRTALRHRDHLHAQENGPIDELPATQVSVPDVAHWREVQTVLDEEVTRLPEKIRLAFVLCYLEGRTNQQAADILGCPLGTILSRLHKARQKLQGQLQRRGIHLSLAALATLLTAQTSFGSINSLQDWLGGRSVIPVVPRSVFQTTLQASLCFADGRESDAISATANALSHEPIFRGITMKLRYFICALIAVALFGVSGTERLPKSTASPRPPVKKIQKKPDNPLPRDERRPRDALEVPSVYAGVVQFVGTEIPPDEKLPATKTFQAVVNGKKVTLRKLKIGDKVKKGQLLARIDDTIIQAEREVKAQDVDIAENEQRAADKAMRHSWRTYQTATAAPSGTFSKAELERLKLVYEQCSHAMAAKSAARKRSLAALAQVEATIRLHEIRAPADGVIVEIYRRPGEAIRALETLIRLKVPQE